MSDKYAKKAREARIIRNCNNKVVYETLEQALIGAKGFKKFKLYPYDCPVCGKIHLTKKEN